MFSMKQREELSSPRGWLAIPKGYGCMYRQLTNILKRHLRDLERRASTTSHSRLPGKTKQAPSQITIRDDEEQHVTVQDQTGMTNHPPNLSLPEPSNRSIAPPDNPGETGKQRGTGSADPHQLLDSDTEKRNTSVRSPGPSPKKSARCWKQILANSHTLRESTQDSLILLLCRMSLDPTPQHSVCQQKITLSILLRLLATISIRIVTVLITSSSSNN